MPIHKNYLLGVIAFAMIALSASAWGGQPAFSWTGFYLGGNIGGDWVDYSSDGFTDTLDTMPLPHRGTILNASTPDFDSTGAAFMGGGQVGYNQQFGWFVLGFEGDFDGTSSSTTKSLFVPVPMGDSGFSVERKFESDWTASARVRAGFAYDRFLFYGTGGGAFTNVNVHATDSFSPTSLLVSSSAGKTEAGWTAGLGVEWAVRKEVSLALEYRHSGFGRLGYGTDGVGPVLSTQSSSVETSNNQVTLRVNLLFNGLLGR